MMISNSGNSVQSCQHVAQTQQTAPVTLLSDADFRAWLRDQADRLAWVNDDDANDLTTYPGESWDAHAYEPTPEAAAEDAAEDAGYARGYALDLSAVPPAGLSAHLRAAWLTGKLDGMFRRHDDDAARAAYEADLAEGAFAGPDRHPEEVVRAFGAIAARAEGGAR
jgi:hypothetical protein